MKKNHFLLLSLLVLTIPLLSFTHKKDAGKAYWFSYFNKGTSKQLYITSVYNNDCNHCDNEITEDFQKWLIMNDYDRAPNGANITNERRDKNDDASERRDDVILRYKEWGYSIIKVGYSFTKK